MLKKFRLQGLDCAHCAEKIERAVSKIPGVHSAEVVFVTGRLLIDTDEGDFPAVLEQAKKIISRVEKDCVITGAL